MLENRQRRFWGLSMRTALILVVLSGLACNTREQVNLEDLRGPIVTSAWVAEAQQHWDKQLVVAEASWAPASEASEYIAGHIPGAIHINTDVFENGSPRWRLRPSAELHAALGELGITGDSIVVVYGHQTNAAARVWWVMEYAGVKDVRYLDGGLEAWKRGGFPLEMTPTALPPARFDAAVREDVLATTSYVREHPEAILADARSAEEYRGEVSGYSYLDAKGRIPGARPVGNAADSALLYQNSDGTLRSADEVRKRWQDAGILGGPEIIFYCGSGWRSSLAFLHARAMGLHNIRNYSDGWSGWSTVYEQTPGPEWRQMPTGNPVNSGQ
jgi:3-mercaptopyruvate sulfurtransferase SseA